MHFAPTKELKKRRLEGLSSLPIMQFQLEYNYFNLLKRMALMFASMMTTYYLIGFFIDGKPKKRQQKIQSI
jgi:hypothetical protein